MKYYYDKFSAQKNYRERVSYNAKKNISINGGYPPSIDGDRAGIGHYLDSKTGLFSLTGKGRRQDSVSMLPSGDPTIIGKTYSEYNYVMKVQSTDYSDSGHDIFGTLYTSQQTDDVKGTLITKDIIAEDGTYPENGKHTDGFWYVKKGLTNKAPSISGKDESLGNISDEINYKYTVFDEDNDTLSIVERLNNTVINVRNDVKSGTEFTLSIPKEDIYKLPIGQENKISIEVSDGQEKVYRNLTFVRTNTAPIIQVLTEKELGEIIAPFTSKVKITDEEGDKVDLVYTTNQIVLDKNNTYKRVVIHTETKKDIKLGTEISYAISKEVFKTMNIGKYELSIKAIDAENGENEEIISFIRTEDTIDFETKPIATEVMPKQFISLIQVVGNPKHSKIMACNNGLDAKPNWEDITKFALDGSPYTFKNTIKTAAKWAVKIKVNIDGKEVK